MSGNSGIQGTGPASQASYANPIKGMTENETLTKLCGGPLGSLKNKDMPSAGGGGGSDSGLGKLFGGLLNGALGIATGGISTMVSGFVGNIFGGTGDKKA